LRRDRLPAEVAGDGYPMVPILDEVDVPQVVHLDRRHRLPSPHRRVELLPAHSQLGLHRKKRRVEVVRPSDRATDVGDRYVREAAVRLPLEPGGAPHLVEGEQRPGVTTEHRPRIAEERLDPDRLEIGPCPQLFHRVAISITRCPTTLITRVSPSRASRTISRPYGWIWPCRRSRGCIHSTARRTAFSPRWGASVPSLTPAGGPWVIRRSRRRVPSRTRKASTLAIICRSVYWWAPSLYRMEPSSPAIRRPCSLTIRPSISAAAG